MLEDTDDWTSDGRESATRNDQLTHARYSTDLDCCTVSHLARSRARAQAGSVPSGGDADPPSARDTRTRTLLRGVAPKDPVPT